MANSLCKIAAAARAAQRRDAGVGARFRSRLRQRVFEAGELDGSYDTIGLGVSSLSDVEVNPGPFNAGVYVSPDIAFGPPLASDTVPEEGWAPIEPQIELSAGSY